MPISPAFKCPEVVNLAFSCGKDSIAFAHWLLQRKTKVIRLIHVNNKLNGDDETAIKALHFADSQNCPIDIIESIPELGNLENECRNSRIRAFQKYSRIVVCHHLGDAVENYVRLCFSGKPEYQPINFISQWNTTTILRPFLLVDPVDIEEYLNKNNLKKFIADDLLTPKSKRNWMRTELLPVINSGGYNLRKIVRKKLLTQLSEIKK